jgi:hypothetical protein
MKNCCAYGLLANRPMLQLFVNQYVFTAAPGMKDLYARLLLKRLIFFGELESFLQIIQNLNFVGYFLNTTLNIMVCIHQCQNYASF